MGIACIPQGGGTDIFRAKTGEELYRVSEQDPVNDWVAEKTNDNRRVQGVWVYLAYKNVNKSPTHAAGLFPLCGCLPIRGFKMFFRICLAEYLVPDFSVRTRKDKLTLSGTFYNSKRCVLTPEK